MVEDARPAIAPGTFGDNLTISGITSADLAIGDRLIAGDVVLEVTAPRIPCGTLAARMDDPGFVKAYRDAARPGAYCRVIKEGEVRAGMDVIHQPYAGEANRRSPKCSATGSCGKRSMWRG